MKSLAIVPAGVVASVGLLIGLLLCTGPYAMGEMADCLKDLDPEKDFGIRFDKVARGSDGPPGPPEAEEIRSRKLIGTLSISNGTGKKVDIWVSNNSTFTDSDLRLVNVLPFQPFAIGVSDPTGNTYL